MWEKTKKWIKDFGGWIVACALFIVTLGKYTADRINDKRTADRNYSDREREAEVINQRLERTAELESEFIEECEEHIESARNTADRIEQSTVTAEQAIEELRRRFAEKKDH